MARTTAPPLCRIILVATVERVGVRYKIPDPPTSPSLISLNGFCGRKAPCFLHNGGEVYIIERVCGYVHVWVCGGGSASRWIYIMGASALWMVYLFCVRRSVAWLVYLYHERVS